MPEAGAAWLWVAAACALLGMGWFALALPAHALQARGGLPSSAQRRGLRAAGSVALLLSLAACLAADHATMAVLVWTMLLAVAATAVAFVLATRPRWLGWLAPWLGPRRFTGG